MLHLLDETLEAFLRAEVPLPARQVDVSFVAPDSEWGAAVTRPTVNLFLWEVRLNRSERESGMEFVEEEGVRAWRPPKPRVDCRYLVTAWTTEIQDEHRLLGDVLAGLLRNGEIGAEHLQGAYAPVRPLPTVKVAEPGKDGSPDLWQALGGKLKPALDLWVTATLDAAVDAEAGPPVERYEIGVVDRDDPGKSDRLVAVGGEAPDAAGSTVTSPRGRAAVDDEGRFLVRADEGDEVEVNGAAAKVPATGSVKITANGGRPKKRG